MELDRFIAYCLVDGIPVDGFLITDRVFDSYAHWSNGTNSRVWLYFKYQDNEYELEYRRYPRRSRVQEDIFLSLPMWDSGIRPFTFDKILVKRVVRGTKLIEYYSYA